MPPKKIKRDDVQVLLKTLVSACRVCRSMGAPSKSIFESGSIMEQIQFCTGVLMMNHSQLSPSICLNCYAKLTIAHKFKISCVQSEETLLGIIKDLPFEIVKTELKVEPKDEIEDEVECNDFYDNDPTFVSNDSFENDSDMKKEVRPKSQTKKRQPKKDTKSLHCDKCDIDFNDVSEASKHERKLHQGPWICEICGKLLNHYTSHYTHMRSHLPPQYACDVCDYKANTKPDLRKHTRVHTGEKRYQCEHCTQTFRFSSNLHGHLRRVHMRVKKHSCDRCHKQFHSRDKLKIHLDSHDNIKRFECEVCHSCYTRRCQWKKHLLKEHSITLPPVRPGRQRKHLIEEVKKVQNGENMFRGAVDST